MTGGGMQWPKTAKCPAQVSHSWCGDQSEFPDIRDNLDTEVADVANGLVNDDNDWSLRVLSDKDTGVRITELSCAFDNGEILITRHRMGLCRHSQHQKKQHQYGKDPHHRGDAAGVPFEIHRPTAGGHSRLFSCI